MDSKKEPPGSMSVIPIVEYPEQIDMGHNTETTELLNSHVLEPEEYYNFTHHIKTDYQEVFMEPRHYDNTPVGRVLAPWINGVAKVAYENVQASFYYVLTLLLGIILSVVWGLLFAVNSFIIVWFYQPSVKLSLVWLRMLSILYKAATRVSLDPVFESCGLIFSKIAGSFNFNMHGLSETTKAMTTKI